MSVELLHLDFLLVFLSVVEDNHFHGALKLLWVLEVNCKTTLAQLIVRFIPGFLELRVKLLIFSSWWSLGTLLSNFVSCSRCLNLQINFLVLVILGLWLQKTLVPHFILVLHFLLFGFKCYLLTLLELLVILLVLFISFNLFCGLATFLCGGTSSSQTSSYIQSF